MRGTVAKRLRKFSHHDTPDLPLVGYTTVVRGQEYKRVMGVKPNETVVLTECGRQYYKLLKRIWKAVK